MNSNKKSNHTSIPIRKLKTNWVAISYSNWIIFGCWEQFFFKKYVRLSHIVKYIEQSLNRLKSKTVLETEEPFDLIFPWFWRSTIFGRKIDLWFNVLRLLKL
jgi:hypothetical protein